MPDAKALLLVYYYKAEVLKLYIPRKEAVSTYYYIDAALAHSLVATRTRGCLAHGGAAQVLRIAEGRLDFETLTYPDGATRGPLVTSFEFMFVFLLFIITVAAKLFFLLQIHIYFTPIYAGGVA